MTPLELALYYAGQGFTLLPVNPITKGALTKNWTNKPDKAPGSSKDPEQSQNGGHNGQPLALAFAPARSMALWSWTLTSTV
jgi:hypothetical protein